MREGVIKNKRGCHPRKGNPPPDSYRKAASLGGGLYDLYIRCSGEWMNCKLVWAGPGKVSKANYWFAYNTKQRRFSACKDHAALHEHPLFHIIVEFLKEYKEGQQCS